MCFKLYLDTLEHKISSCCGQVHSLPFSGFLGVKKFSTGSQLSKYLHVVCRNTNGACLKSVSKTPTFRFLWDFQLFQHPAKIQHPAKWTILDSFWPKLAKRDSFSKKRLEHFFDVKSPNYLQSFRKK